MKNSDQAEYLSLSAASKLLGVHGTTLRRWADAGLVPVYVTPGGHRRFARADLAALAVRKPVAQAVTASWAQYALVKTRSDLAQQPQRHSWLNGLAENDRDAWRRIGQQLMGVVLRFVDAQGDDAALLAEARAIGTAYAQHALQAGMPLTTALEAALYFRDTLVEAAMDLPEGAGVRGDTSARLLRRISRVVNAVQLAVAEEYERA